MSIESQNELTGKAKPGIQKRRRQKTAIPRRRLDGSQAVFFQSVPFWIWVLVGVGVVWAIFTPNPVLTVSSLLLLPLLTGLLWFRGAPPVLLFACCIQWLQAATGIFYCNFLNVPLSTGLDLGGSRVEEATYLSLVGVLVLAVGMRMALIRWNRRQVQQAQAEARSLQAGRLFVIYLITFAFSTAIRSIAATIPRLTQPLLAFDTIRWVMLFLLVYSVLINRRPYVLLGLAIGLELLVGFIGFFAGFKSSFFILLIALAGTGVALKGWRLFQFIIVAAFLFVFCILWTTVKPEYRDYLNQGTGQQVVNVPIKQRLDKLGELTRSLNAAKFENGFELLLQRISYVDYFALTIQNVPANIPYERGELWWGAIKQVFMPRLFFPNKPVLDDSARTSYYTGLRVAGAEQGTSIGIGYMGESYIDFGPVGMFAPIFLLGLFYGSIYRLFITHSPRKIIGVAIAVSILAFGAYEIETSNIKLLGGSVVVCVAMILFLKFGATPVWKAIASPYERPPNQRPRSHRKPKDGNAEG